MRRDLATSARAVVVLTILLGLLYPIAVWGIGRVAFPGKAGGSKIENASGQVVGSRLIGQDFGTKKQYFHSRPSATGYNPAATYFANRGPNAKSASAFYEKQLAAYLELEGAYVTGLDAAGVPVDAVTASASGVDPHISPANAGLQAHRIAELRNLPLERVQQLIDDHTDRRFLGLLGEPGVNVLELNLALDQEAPVQ
jgi:K+-transporting ATPase ATPase C chain